MPVNTLANDWNRELRSPVFRARFRAAREAEPVLSRFVDAWALVRFMRRPAEPAEKDAVLCALLGWAKREPVGARVVLETIRPGLLNMACRLLSDTRDADELWAIIVAALWEGIRDYPLPRRRRRVAANLLLDAMHRTLVVLGRESEWRSMWVGFDRKTPAPEAVEGDIDELLDGAVRACAISADEAEVICASRIDGVPLADLARSAGVSYNTMKLRRQRAERRLLMFLGYRPVPRGQQNRPLSLARVTGAGSHGPVG
jgi:DNA-directed RNA polymerase specialized sigma24 family protein